GPGIVSGRFGDPSISSAGIGLGGANNIAAVGDFNADGSPDIVVTGTRIINNVNFRSSIYLIGNATAGTVRVVRPQRSAEYGGTNPLIAGNDTFISCVTGNFSQNGLPSVLHLSLNGKIWVDSDVTPLLNSAPILTIRRQDLRAPFPGG